MAFSPHSPCRHKRFCARDDCTLKVLTAQGEIVAVTQKNDAKDRLTHLVLMSFIEKRQITQGVVALQIKCSHINC